MLRDAGPPDARWLTLLLTNRCPLSCAHCGPMSGPKQTGIMALECAIEALDTAKARGFGLVNLSGGEPFAIGERLQDIADAACQRQFWVRITTGGSWATTPEAATSRLRPLAASGVQQICVSCSDEHQAFVPLSNVIRATRAAWDLGIDVFLNVGVSVRTKLTPEVIRLAFSDARLVTPPVLESPLIPFGRAATTLDASRQCVRPIGQIAGPCPSMRVHPTVFENGTVAGCAGVLNRDCTPLHFGNTNVDSVETILTRLENHPLSVWISTFGLVALKELIESNSDIRFGSDYVNICHLCGDILNNAQAQQLLREVGFLES